jgi:hypothetical protein
MVDHANVLPLTAPRKAAPDDFTRRKFEWLERISLDPSVGPFAFRVAFVLSGFFNRTTGRAFPSQETLALRLGATVRGIQKALRQLCEAGYLTVIEALGRGHTNQYSPTVENTNDGSPFTSENTNGCSPFVEGNNEQPFRKTRTAVRTEPFEEPSEEKPSSSVSCKSKAEATSKLGSKGIDDQFAKWWSCYPRKVEKKGAQSIYVRLVKKGDATPEQLLAGAMAYSAACANRDRKYIKHPTTWLDRGCWADEAIATTAPSSNGVDWAGHLARFRETGAWLPILGPRPDVSGCRAPPDLLRQKGFLGNDPLTRRPAATAMPTTGAPNVG